MRPDQVRRIGVRVVIRTLAVAVLCVALLAAPASAQTSGTIVAGQSVAGVRIGSNANDAISVFGNLVDQGDSRSGKYVIYNWPLRPVLLVAEKESSRIVFVVVSSTDSFRTDRGVTGGSERAAVEAAYGRDFTVDDDQSSTTLIYDAQGIAFDIGKRGVMDGRVVSIFIFVPGQWKQITEAL